jgi:hypothetical protein
MHMWIIKEEKKPHNKESANLTWSLFQWLW